MLRSSFHYHLPPERIAQLPCAERSGSRLLLLDPLSDAIEDRMFRDFPDQVRAGDLVVFNDTRVIPARLHGVKETGGRVEVLVERILDHGQVLAMVRASKPPASGSRLWLEQSFAAGILAREGDLYRLQFPQDADTHGLLERYGHMPLPPYIERADTEQDQERYQTVYARAAGAVAAPTAGLHFDRDILERLSEKGVRTASVTLHVGAGTFQPVRTEQLDQHVMHGEIHEVGRETCELVTRTRAGGGRVIAVGTTVVRSLESAAASGSLVPVRGETRLFITPGFRFRVVDALLTNFHLPESTLLMLVCAFAGYRRTMDAYAHAIAAGYRFYSYGDAMFIPAREQD